MKMSFSIIVWKYGLLTFNILISVVAVIIISCGVLALGGAGSTKGAYLAAGVGFMVLSLCFVGCFASLRESYMLSIIFVGFAVLAIILQTIFMVCFASMKETLLQDTTNRVDDLWEKEAKHPGAMDGVQMQYYCCGKDSPQDYLQDDDDVLPNSCCVLRDCSDDDNIYSKGCSGVVVKFFNDLSDDLILSIVGLIALEIVALICAYFLAKGVQHIVHKTEQIVISE